MRNSIDVHNYLVERDVPHEVFPTPGPLGSPEQLAAVLDLPPDEVGKVVIFDAGGQVEGVAAVIPSNVEPRPDLVRRAAGRPDLRAAADDRVVQLTDYLPGTVPPAGLPANIAVIVDRALAKDEVRYFLGGEGRIVLKIRGTDLVRATGATVASISAPTPVARAEGS